MSPAEHPRVRRERRTIRAMVDLYCGGRHAPAADREHCRDCSELLDYAHARVERCPFQEDKPPCAACPIHCYVPARREQIRQVMRYAGPRMLLRHPWFALRHWLDGFRRTPPVKRRRGPPA